MCMAGLSRLDSAYLRMQTNDYSTLFNSMNRSSSGSSNMFDISGKSNNSLSANFYADYASLKNGSYFKLAKSYYAKSASETTDSASADSKTGSRNAFPGKTVTIKDTVSYTGLKEGTAYTVTGILMDKETGKELKVSGKTVEAENSFTAEAAEGKEEAP